MKFEKREITLNEYDSLSDMLGICQQLLSLYQTSACLFECKERRAFLKECTSATLDETYFLKDLVNGVLAEQV